MPQYINVNDFKLSQLEPNKLYTLYYELSDEQLNNNAELGVIINHLWDKFILNDNLDSNIHLDKKNKVIEISVKLKNNVLIEDNGKIKSLSYWLGSNILNAISPLLNIAPIKVTVEPLIVKVVEGEIETLSKTPIIATTVNSAGNLVNNINKAFETTSKILPYLPYILIGCFAFVILSKSDFKNIKKLF